jgi:hypothetical protein
MACPTTTSVPAKPVAEKKKFTQEDAACRVVADKFPERSNFRRKIVNLGFKDGDALCFRVTFQAQPWASVPVGESVFSRFLKVRGKDVEVLPEKEIKLDEERGEKR